MVKVERRRRLESQLDAQPNPEADAAQRARASLPEFVRQAWHVVEPAYPLVWGWHLDAVSWILERVTRGVEKRVILLMPPGTMKSLMVSVLHPAWEWTNDPGLRSLTFTYADKFAIRDAVRMRSLVSSQWYRRRFGVSLKLDQAAKTRFETHAGGWRVSSSVGGLGTGEHPDRIIIDDPMKAGETLSQAALDQVKFWFDRVVSTRLARDPSIIVVMQRLHLDDLAGHLIRLGGWRVVTLPMRFVKDKADALDQRVEDGELLWPTGLWSPEKVAEEELHLGAFGVAGQLQQNPVPEGGGIYKRAWFARVVDRAPTKARRCRGWDTASLEGRGDWTVGVKLADADGTIYVEDVVRVQEGPAAVDNLIVATAQLDGKRCMIREEKEGGSSGEAVITARAKRLRGFDYRGVRITGDKITRGKNFRTQAEAGNVVLVRGNWNTLWLQEMESIGAVGRHDDQHDATGCAMNALIEEGPRSAKLTW